MAKQLVAILDYGMGNLHSARSALEHLGENAEIVVSDDIALLRRADRLVFPGVGAIRDCMAEIRRLGFDSLIREQVQIKPVLAICVGMQALMTRSMENGGVDCIDLFDGVVRKFDTQARDLQGNRLKVPHMGWNRVDQLPHAMWQGIESGERFYFVHSFFVEPVDIKEATGFTDYGQRFACALARKNLFAVQFHPEKSQYAGLQLLRNFLRWDGEF